MLEQAQAKACCADLYQSDLARTILGDTLHPGGLALTNRLAKLLEIAPGAWVVDLASARGTSAGAVSRVFKCKVVGVEFGRAAVMEAHARSLPSWGDARSYYVQGDAELPPLRPGAFDAVFCECSMSLFPDKSGTVVEAASLLRPGGRFGLSDVTLAPNSLPVELHGALGQMLCLTNALDVDGYARLLQEGGLRLVQQIDVSAEIVKILDVLETRLGAFLSWQRFSGQGVPETGMLGKAPDLISKLRGLIVDGRLGYWIFVGEKPAP